MDAGQNDERRVPRTARGERTRRSGARRRAIDIVGKESPAALSQDRRKSRARNGAPMGKNERTTVMRMQRIIAALILVAGCSNESSPTGTNGPVPTIQVYKS